MTDILIIYFHLFIYGGSTESYHTFMETPVLQTVMRHTKDQPVCYRMLGPQLGFHLSSDISLKIKKLAS
jgi:hypothetical protein